MIVHWLLVSIAVTPGPDPAPAPAPVGQILASVEKVDIRRGAATFRAGPRAALYQGDVVATRPDGGASFFLFEGHSVYLGPSTTVALGRGPQGQILQLSAGEARATADARSVLSIGTPQGLAGVERGTVRAAISEAGTRVWAEQGAARVTSVSGDEARLETGRETLVPPRGARAAPSAAKADAWSVRVDDLQMAGAAASSRRAIRGVAGGASDESAAGAVASGQVTPPPGPAPPVGDPTGPGGPATPESTAAAQPAAVAQPNTAADGTEEAYQPVVVAQPNTGSSSSVVSLALGNVSAASGVGLSGGLFSDAQQDSFNLNFPGNVHLVTAQTDYTLNQVKLTARDAFPATRQFWSIGLGASPTGQVRTTFNTGSAPTPQTLRIPGFNAYLVQFPQAQFGIPDPATANAGTLAAGVTGLLGAVPVAPQVSGATPFRDSSARFNDRASFALGQFSVQTLGDHPQFSIRRSDQDRRILKDPTGNDLKDVVTPNPDVRFARVQNVKFFPELPFVYAPASPNPVRNPPTYRGLDLFQKAAFTTLVADELAPYAARTGQTRFVINDGTRKEVVDVTGYKRNNNDLLRSGQGLPGHSTLRSGATLAGHAAGRHHR